MSAEKKCRWKSARSWIGNKVKGQNNYFHLLPKKRQRRKKKTLIIKLTISKDGKTLTLNSTSAEYAGSQASEEGIVGLFSGNEISKIFKKEK